MGPLAEEWEDKSLGRILLDRLMSWYRSLDKPNPWPDDVEKAVHSPHALPVCHHCLLPQEYYKNRWFCSECGHASGPYNNILPYIRLFSIGEVFRSGVGQEARYTFSSITGYIFAGFLQMFILFPFYALRLLCGMKRQIKLANGQENTHESRRLSRLFTWAIALCLLLLFSFLAFTARVFSFMEPAGPRISQSHMITYSMPIRSAETNYPPDTEVLIPMPTQTTQRVLQRHIIINGPM